MPPILTASALFMSGFVVACVLCLVIVPARRVRRAIPTVGKYSGVGRRAGEGDPPGMSRRAAADAAAAALARVELIRQKAVTN